MEYEVREQIRKASNTAFLMIIIYLGFQLAASIVVGIILGIHMVVTRNINPDEMLVNIITLVLYLIMYPIGVPILWKIFKHTKIGKLKPTSKEMFQKSKVRAGKIFKWVLIFLSLSYLSSIAANLLFALIEKLTGFSLTSIDMIPSDNAVSRLSLSLIIMIFAPIFEEILFRGTVYNSCEQLGGWSMVIACGIIFGLFHMNYSQIIYAAVLGVGACFLYKKTRSLIPGIILHLSMNVLGGLSSLAVSFIDEDKLDLIMNGNMQAIEAMDNTSAAPIITLGVIVMMIYAIIIVGLVLFIIELVKHRDSFRLYKGNTEISEKKKFALFFTSPLAVVCVLLLIGITVLNAVGLY